MIFNSDKRDDLLNQINEIVSKEINNGVKKVYLKAIKHLQD
jgi:hypothetical protein